MLKNRAIKSFSSSKIIYGREIEKNQIKEFVKSSNQILHITGCPGTGKTATVKSTLLKMPFHYVNYYNDPKINLQKVKEKIIIIDEFDKYFEEKKAECLMNISSIRHSERKLITICNNLSLVKNEIKEFSVKNKTKNTHEKTQHISFNSYEAEEIQKILKEKMVNELGEMIMDEKCLIFLAKKFQKAGDLRTLFKEIVSVLVNKEIDNDEIIELKIQDFIKNEKKQEQGIHHQIIMNIKDNNSDQNESFKKYLKECNEQMIAPLSKNDFKIVFEMILK